MVSQGSTSARKLRREAVSLLQTGRFRRALMLLQQALELEPGHIGALTNLGAARRGLGDLPGAIACYREALQLAPDSAATGFNLANALKEAGRFDDAIAAYGRVLEIDAGHLLALNNMGIAYKQVGRSDDAEACFRRALNVKPGYGAALRNLATVHEDKGDFVAARQCFAEALTNNPADAKALSKIISSRVEAAKPQHLELATKLLQQAKIDSEGRAQLHYGLGKYHDRSQAYDQALMHFRRANEIKLGRQAFAGGAVFDRVDKLISVFTPELFARFKNARNTSAKPVFVIGLPRSGTTLTEQVLSSHPRIAGAGELPFFGSVALEFSGRTGIATAFPKGVAAMDAASIDLLAREYLSVLEDVSADSDRVIDKMPQNFLYLGLIALVFSEARIVHCWRDPRDVCLSCFVEDFNAAHSFASDPVHFAAYNRAYGRLLAHWRQVLPLPIFDLRYEDLVTDFEPTARSLVDFVGCDWNESCLRYYEQSRSVTTPSRWQVRQPIYTSSIGRWRHYRDYLAPVLEELSQLAEAGPPGVKV